MTNQVVLQRLFDPLGARFWGLRARIDSLRAQILKNSRSLEIFNLAWKFQSRLKFSILTSRIPHKNRGLVGGSLENFKLAWKFQDLKFFKIWALRVCQLPKIVFLKDFVIKKVEGSVWPVEKTPEMMARLTSNSKVDEVCTEFQAHMDRKMADLTGFSHENTRKRACLSELCWRSHTPDNKRQQNRELFWDTFLMGIGHRTLKTSWKDGHFQGDKAAVTKLIMRDFEWMCVGGCTKAKQTWIQLPREGFQSCARNTLLNRCLESSVSSEPISVSLGPKIVCVRPVSGPKC